MEPPTLGSSAWRGSLRSDVAHGPVLLSRECQLPSRPKSLSMFFNHMGVDAFSSEQSEPVPRKEVNNLGIKHAFSALFLLLFEIRLLPFRFDVVRSLLHFRPE